VIGFDVSDASKAKAHAQLKCVAESTGGKFFAANDAEGLKAALTETAKAVAEPAPKAEVAAPKEATNTATGIQLSAIPTEGASAFSKFLDVAYSVYENTQDMDGRRNKVANSSNVNPVFKLAAGEYLVNATRGNSTVSTVIKVKAGEMIQHTFNLKVGNLKLSALASEDSKPFSKFLAVNYSVYEDKKDMDGKRTNVISSGKAHPLFKLAARSYIIVASRGNASAEKRIEVKAGERVEASFNLNTGNLKLSALPSKGAEAFSKFLAVNYSIYTDKKDMDGKRTNVTNSSDAHPLFKLAAGKYVLIATRKDTGVQIEATIEIKAGELLEKTVIISENTPVATTETTPDTTKSAAEPAKTTPAASTTESSSTTTKASPSETPSKIDTPTAPSTAVNK
jgi:Ca-activated chloride channel family protein